MVLILIAMHMLVQRFPAHVTTIHYTAKCQ